MFIIGESLQNLPNIVNSAVIKADWQSVWKSASLLWVYPLCREQQQQCWNDKKFRIKLEGWSGSLFWQQIASECCWIFNKRSSPRGVHRALFSIRMSEEFLALRRDQNHRHSRGNGSQRWRRTQKNAAVNTKIDTLFTRNNSIMANKRNIDSHGSSYCNLEQSVYADCRNLTNSVDVC